MLLCASYAPIRVSPPPTPVAMLVANFTNFYYTVCKAVRDDMSSNWPLSGIVGLCALVLTFCLAHMFCIILGVVGWYSMYRCNLLTIPGKPGCKHGVRDVQSTKNRKWMYLAPEPTREGELPEHWLWYQVLMGVCNWQLRWPFPCRSKINTSDSSSRGAQSMAQQHIRLREDGKGRTSQHIGGRCAGKKHCPKATLWNTFYTDHLLWMSMVDSCTETTSHSNQQWTNPTSCLKQWLGRGVWEIEIQHNYAE